MTENKITDYSQRPRMMPVHSPILQVKQNLADANKRIVELTELLDQWVQRCNVQQAEYDTLLEWSQAAYVRLNSLMAIGVSISPDAHTAALLDAAPGDVKGVGR